jgi:hypothetical protein
MRNLTSTFSECWNVTAAQASGSRRTITKTAVNPEDDTLFVLSEKKDDSGMVELEVLKAQRIGSGRALQVSTTVCEHLQMK